jgi:hypothetical protein
MPTSGIKISSLPNVNTVEDADLFVIVKTDDVTYNITRSDITISANNIVDTLDINHGGTGQTTANAALNALLPTQTSNDGKFLSTNGTNTSWVTANTLPSQTGNNGKFLTTDGSNASWATVLPSQTGHSGHVLTTDGTNTSWIAVVSGVSNSDGTLIVNPTAGNVVASLNLGNANTWTSLQTFQCATNSTVGLTARGAASQNTNLQEWQRSDFTVLSAIDKYGAVIVGPVDIDNATEIGKFNRTVGTFWSFRTSGQLYCNMASTNAGQGAINLGDGSALIWTDSTGSAYDLRLDGWNSIILRPGRLSSGGSTVSVQIIGQQSTKVPLIVQGAASHSANLQEWKNSAGATLAYIDASGTFSGTGIISGTYATMPAAGQAGRVYIATDSILQFVDSGTVWQGFMSGHERFTIPDFTSYSWDNQESTTLVDKNGWYEFRKPTSSSLSMYYRTAPATPWTYTTYMPFFQRMIAFPAIGIGVRDSSGKIHFFGIKNDGSNVYLSSDKYTNTSTFSANYAQELTYKLGFPFWFRIADNGTNRICSYSFNGVSFVTFHTVGRTDFLTATQYGIIIAAPASAGVETVAGVYSLAI